MRDELLRCNRDMLKGNMLVVAMSEDIVARGVSQMLKKKPGKPKFSKKNRGPGEEEEPEQSTSEQKSEEASEAAPIKSEQEEE
jgi:hypothetical protein